MLTIFTPTFNRAELLKRVYDSLLRQREKNFSWLIVDDGSTDNTKEVVEEWLREGRINIQYEYQENGGKMRAHNQGVNLCNTELFLCLDSDDFLTEDAVEIILSCYEKKIKGNPKYGGIVAHKGEDVKTPLYGAIFPKVRESTLYGLYERGFSGETTLIFRTQLLKQHLFPEIPGEKYVPEDYVYDQIDKNYVLYVVPKVLTLCQIVKDGYTDNVKKLREENPYGWFLYYRQRASLAKPSLLKLKYISHYLRFASTVGENVWRKTELSKGWLLLGIPGALLLFAAKKK